MKIIISEKLSRILKNREQLETELEVEITHRGKEVSITGTPENEYLAEKVIDAINFGFPLSDALSILNEEFLFEVIPIKEHTKRKDLERIRARIIGTGGRTLATLNNLTKCSFEIKDNEVAIIGPIEYIPIAQEAVTSIIKGTKQANVYAYLEKHQPTPVIDLGLKPKKER